MKITRLVSFILHPQFVFPVVLFLPFLKGEVIPDYFAVLAISFIFSSVGVDFPFGPTHCGFETDFKKTPNIGGTFRSGDSVVFSASLKKVGSIYFESILLYSSHMKWLSTFIVVLLTFGVFCPMTLDLHHASENAGEPQCEVSDCFVHVDGQEPLLALDMQTFIPMPIFEWLLNEEVPHDTNLLSDSSPPVKIASTKTIVLRL
ncbi:MAG: hypothetical protein WC924_00590 [Candidatus Gracilibacteria bacterium]